MTGKLKVLLFGTHPNCYNGYCLVTYNIAKELAKKDDIELTIFAFQNFYMNQQHIKEREIPSNVYIYDAFANENPKGLGFGFEQVKDIVSMIEPDICVLYNDMVVVSTIMSKLKEIPNPTFKTMVYIDQVYLYQKNDYVKLLNESADYVLCFTPYWEEIAKGIGITKPTGFLQHGFDPLVNYPIPKMLARQYFGLKKDDFIIMNLNRNQPRKRWDICLQAFAEVVSRHINEPIKLLIATAVQGAWNLMEVYERELKKRGITLEDGMKHIILIDNPQQLSDEDVNILYNVANIGINTCDGEGFGLCNFQQAAIGIPQIVPNIGGFLDFFNKERAAVIEPKFNLYIDSGRDGVGGESQICHWEDFANALDNMYSNYEDATQMAQRARKYIIENYRWKDICDKFHKQLLEVCNKPEKNAPVNISMKLIEQWENELKENTTEVVETSVKPSVETSVETSVKPSVETSVKPSVETSVEPSVETSVKPSVETSVKPSVETSVKPSVETSVEDIEKIDFKEDSDEDEIIVPLKKRGVVKKTNKVEGKKKVTSEQTESLDKESLLALREKIDKLLVETSSKNKKTVKKKK